ncbi:MAG: signal peptidase I [Acutalibacteraceae bacterium]
MKNKKLKSAVSVICLILCVVFGAVLICNLTVIIKGVINPDRPPSVLGVTPMVVQSGSMSGSAEDHIEVGDLIFIKNAEFESLKEGQVISFMEGSIVVTHRIVGESTDENGERGFITKGDANNTEDELLVTKDNFIGVYFARVPKLGDFAMFMQKPLGMLIFIGIPLCAFIIYDIIRRVRTAEREDTKTRELEEELARLRAMNGESARETKPADEAESNK